MGAPCEDQPGGRGEGQLRYPKAQRSRSLSTGKPAALQKARVGANSRREVGAWRTRQAWRGGGSTALPPALGQGSSVPAPGALRGFFLLNVVGLLALLLKEERCTESLSGSAQCHSKCSGSVVCPLWYCLGNALFGSIVRKPPCPPSASLLFGFLSTLSSVALY